MQESMFKEQKFKIVTYIRVETLPKDEEIFNCYSDAVKCLKEVNDMNQDDIHRVEKVKEK